jgi:hypothetical protein
MRKKFPGYFKLTESEIKELWDNALITLDANILLNLYRYSDETKENFFKILEKIKDRVWIPHHSAREFFDNRLNVISQQKKAYEDAISSLKKVEEEFKNFRQHPFISKKSLKKFSALTEEICGELDTNKQFHDKRIVQDDILERIEKLFEDKVGEEFDKEKMNELFKKGEERFKEKIPPGYKDSGKKDLTEKNIRKYGDYIVWEQILTKSKDDKFGVILVTDDRKEDWWFRFNGKTLGPRPELIKEFKSITNQSFHMYQPDRFLEFARDYLNEDVKQNSIDEIRELRRLDEKNRLSNLNRQKVFLGFRKYKEDLLKIQIELADETKLIAIKQSSLQDKLNDQYLILDNSDPSSFDYTEIRNMQKELKIAQIKRKNLMLKSKELQNEYISLQNKALNNNE